MQRRSAQGYSGAYPSRASSSAVHAYDPNGRLIHRSVTHGNITTSYGPDGRLVPYYTVRNGNIAKTYSTNGQLLRTAFKRGNTFVQYDRNGRLTARGDYNTGRLYDARGRYLGSTSR